jgi:predicted dehydrogenase
MSEPGSPFRLLIVGLGLWGETLVKSVQGRSDLVRFTGACVRRPDAARAFAESQGLMLFTDLATALSESGADGLVVATPHSQHEAHVLAGLEAGLPVFVEKPLALSRESALRMFARAEERGLPLAVGFNRRFAPAMIGLRRLVADGSLGRVQFVEGNFSGRFGYRYQPGMWRADPQEAPAGGMTPLGIHLVDAMIDLAGPIEAAATVSKRVVLEIEQDDTTCASLRFAGGALGSLTTLTTTAPFWRVQVFGSDGWAEMQGHERLMHAPLDGPVTETRFEAVDIERAELEAFAEAARGGPAFPVTRDQALQGMAALEAIIRSAAAAGDWVRAEN